MSYPYSSPSPLFRPPTKKLCGGGLYLGLESPPVSASTKSRPFIGGISNRSKSVALAINRDDAQTPS